MITLDNLQSEFNLVSLKQQWQSKMRFCDGDDPDRADDDNLTMSVCKLHCKVDPGSVFMRFLSG